MVQIVIKYVKWRYKGTLIHILTALCYHMRCLLMLSYYFLYVIMHSEGIAAITWYISTMICMESSVIISVTIIDIPNNIFHYLINHIITKLHEIKHIVFEYIYFIQCEYTYSHMSHP